MFSNPSYIGKATCLGLVGLLITACYEATKETSFSNLRLLQSHIIVAIFWAVIVFLLSAAFLRREQRLTEKLLAAKDLSEALIESLPGVVCIFDAAGNVRRWNSNFLGYPAAERFRIGIFDMVAQESHEIVRQAMKDAFESGSGEVEAWLLAKSGARVPCYLKGVRIIFENQPCILGIGIDVSKRTRVQEHAKPQAATLEAEWYIVESPRSGESPLTHPAMRLGPFTTEDESRGFLQSVKQMPRFSNSVFELRKRRERRDKRLKVEYPVRLKCRSGSNDASRLAHTVDVSASGACLGGLKTKLNTGEVISLRCDDREAPFQVVWVGSGATEGQAGLECLVPRVNIWKLDLPQQTEDERLLQEVDRARTVQRKLLPQEKPPLRTLDYGGLCVQARTVGGDYYDFLPIAPGEVGLVVADVAGKGIAAALLMANLQGILQAQAAFDCKDLARLLGSVNRQLHEHTESARYATLFFSCYSDLTRSLRYVNCGHNPPLLLRQEGVVERLGATSSVLGLFRDWDCSVAEVHLDPGDVVSMYTDGITETLGKNGEEFGEARLLSALRINLGLDAQCLVQKVEQVVQEFRLGEQHDDVTMVVARSR